MKIRRVLPFLLLASVLAHVRPACAEPDDSSRMHLDVGAGSHVPLLVGAEATLELPSRLLFQTEIGWMPRPYVALINTSLVELGAYDDTTATLIESALGNSMIVRLSAGYRPFARAGFEVFAGYTLAVLGGGLSGREVIEAVSTRELPPDADREIPLHSTTHSLHAGLAWRFLVNPRLVIRVSLSYFQTVASSSGIDVTARTQAGANAVAEIDAEIDAYLDDIYTTYVKAPLVGVIAAYRY